MNLKINTFAYISISLASLTHAMEENHGFDPHNPTHYEDCLAKMMLDGNLERTIVAYNVSNPVFSAFASHAQPRVEQLFKRKGIIVTDRLPELEQDTHLAAMAQRAQLGGLCIYARENNRPNMPVLEAMTADSITTFFGNTIYHAIAVEPRLYEIATQSTDTAQQTENRALLFGMIEREIARITLAYSHSDAGVEMCKLTTQSSAGALCGIASAVLCPWTLPVVVLTGLVLHEMRKEAIAINAEMRADATAIQLAQNAENILATLEHGNTIITKKCKAKAERALTSGTNRHTLDLLSLRLYTALEAQQHIKKDQ